MNGFGPIVLDALVLRPRISGVGRSVLELVEAMAKEDRGLDFVVLTTNPELFPFLDGVDRWRVLECPGARGNLLRKALFTQFQLPRLCRQLGASLLHSMQFIGPLRLNCPSVVTVHDLTWQDFPETIEQPRLAYYRFLAPRVLARATRILANSEATGSELAYAFPDLAGKIATTRFATPSWVWRSRERMLATPSVSTQESAAEEEKPYFLFVSTLEPRKNLQGLVRAYELFLDQALKDGRKAAEIPDLHLAGPRGWKDAAVKDALARLKGSGRLHLLDYRSGDDLWERYRLARALLFPSFHEGFGFPILEAMSAGLPVMTSNRGAMAEVGGSCVLLVNPDNIEEMAKALATLTWNRDIMEDLSARGLARALDWTWDETARLTCEEYHHVLDTK